MLQEMTDTASSEESDLEETLSAAAKCSIISLDNLIIICVFLKKMPLVVLFCLWSLGEKSKAEIEEIQYECNSCQ